VGARPTRQPLQPEATGAGMEVTKCLKPSDSSHEFGDGASVRAAMRVNAEQASHEALGVKRIVSERQWQISSICLSGTQGSEPDCMTRLVFEHDQPHIRSPFATAAPTSRLRRAGLRKTRTILENGVSGHGLLRFVDLDPSGLILSWGLRDWLGAYRHAVFITAPSMTTPAVTYFQSATSSFRASATIVVLRRRPPLRFTRSWNQRASAESG